MRQFYTHLVEIESIMVELEKMALSADEKLHLAHLVDSSLHNTILDVILSQLHEEDKKRFIKHLNEGSHDKIWQFLNDRVDNIEEEIKKAAEDLKKQLHEDLKKAKNLR